MTFKTLTTTCLLLLAAQILLAAPPSQPQTTMDKQRPDVIDNAKLIPLRLDDTLVKLEASGRESVSPDWVKSLIIVEVNIATASPDHKFSGMNKVLDHLAQMGVNGIWITPINENPHYGNFGIHTLNTELTGTNNPAEQWQRVRDFVNEAHRRNIRVFIDVVSWGVTKKAPLYTEKPEWFSGPSQPEWNGWLWKWQNQELCEWFSSRLVDLVLMTGADGIRCDSSPGFAGYEPYRTAKKRLLSMGKKVIFISEHPSERRGVFDFDQLSFMYKGGNTGTRFPCRVFITGNIVDIIQRGDLLGSVDAQLSKAPVNMNGGKERFYSFPLSCHDNRGPRAPTELIEFAYQSLFSPFIPIWYLGEEWRNPHTVSGWDWPNPVKWELLAKEQVFFEQIKQMIRIRRQYPAIFEYFPLDHRKSNIAKVQTNHPELLQAYVRFHNDTAIMIVPNNGNKDEEFRIMIPYHSVDFSPNAKIEVTDLLSGQKICAGITSELSTFSVNIAHDKLGIFLVRPQKNPPQ